MCVWAWNEPWAGTERLSGIQQRFLWVAVSPNYRGPWSPGSPLEGVWHSGKSETEGSALLTHSCQCRGEAGLPTLKLSQLKGFSVSFRSSKNAFIRLLSKLSPEPTLFFKRLDTSFHLENLLLHQLPFFPPTEGLQKSLLGAKHVWAFVGRLLGNGNLGSFSFFAICWV